MQGAVLNLGAPGPSQISYDDFKLDLKHPSTINSFNGGNQLSMNNINNSLVH